MPKKVFVAMSGGVDSSAAAYLLLRQGWNVAGITMSISNKDSSAVIGDAKKIADALKIEHFAFDLSDAFNERVIEPFVNEYLSGKTPNPCILCNKSIKWGLLYEKAAELGGDYFATGHYVNIVNTGGRMAVKKSAVKDQSYALYALTQPQLKRTIFPLAEYSKDKIRDIAKNAGLDVFNKPDSQEICFIEDNCHSRFIERHTGRKEEKGEFVLADGTVLGFHNGISNYTIGQRKGLGISYSEPLFVLKTDARNNRVLLGKDADLYSSAFTVKNVNYMGAESINGKLECKIRYAHKGAECTVTQARCADKLYCVFTKPQRAVTPGQSAVFYDENGVVLAGGIIEQESI